VKRAANSSTAVAGPRRSVFIMPFLAGDPITERDSRVPRTQTPDCMI